MAARWVNAPDRIGFVRLNGPPSWTTTVGAGTPEMERRGTKSVIQVFFHAESLDPFSGFLAIGNVGVVSQRMQASA